MSQEITPSLHASQPTGILTPPDFWARQRSQNGTRAETTVDKALRLLHILRRLQSRPADEAITACDLAQECRCDERSIRRYFRLLRTQFDINYDKSHRTYTLSSNDLPPLLHLSINDARNLGLLRHLLCLPGMPQQSNVVGTLDKIINLLTTEHKKIASGLEQTMALSALPRDYSQAPIALLHTARERQLTVRIDYDSRSSQQRSFREVDPYEIALREGVYWELHAWCHTRRKFLTFALDRVHQVELTTLRYRERPQEWEAFSRQQNVGGIRGDSESVVSVRVRIASPMSAYIREVHTWPDTLTFTEYENEGVLMAGTVPAGDSLLRLVSVLLSFRSSVCIEGSPELLTAYQGELMTMAANHGLIFK